MYSLLQGWLTTKAVDAVEVQLKEKLGEGEYVFLPLEIAEEEYEEVPTVLENNAFLQPFENLTEMYGLPKYGELDPTALYSTILSRLLRDDGSRLRVRCTSVVGNIHHVEVLPF